MKITTNLIWLVAVAQVLAACSMPVVDEPTGSRPPAAGAGAEQGLAKAVGEATTDVGRDVELLRLAEGHVQRLATLLEDVRRQRDQGALTNTDVAQVEGRLAQARARLAVSKGNLARSRARYKAVVGQPAPGEDP